MEDASGTDSLRLESTDAAGSDAKQAESGRDDTENIHVEVKIPNTTLLMSTLYGQDSYRNHFIPALAEDIRKADGVRTLHDMFIDASHSMTGHSDMNRQHQNPEYRTSNRKHLIIPKRLTDEEVINSTADFSITVSDQIEPEPVRKVDQADHAPREVKKSKSKLDKEKACSVM